MDRPRVGIVGAGQLGRMMALAAYPLGIECRFVDSDLDSPGGQVASIRTAALDDAAAIEALARECDVLTFDIENVSVEILAAVASICPVRPEPEIVAAAQDRLTEKQLFQSLGIPVAPFFVIDDGDSLQKAAATLGVPLVLKLRRLGYDGRGQRIVQSPAELEAAWESLGRGPAIAEGWVTFERELSLIAVRGRGGECRFYSLSENAHDGGILISARAPYPDATLQAQAEDWLRRLMQQFDYRGALTVEFFATGNGLVANEMAPRVHNSGHWTIEGAETSQFENHIRAILDLPLGSTSMRGHAAMLNLLGEMPPREGLLAVEGVHLHDYGKAPRPLRKLGHCTITDSDRARLDVRFEALREKLSTYVK
jgi:5-(carboxyamino)imidazole ribonucleotide synthase